MPANSATCGVLQSCLNTCSALQKECEAHVPCQPTGQARQRHTSLPTDSHTLFITSQPAGAFTRPCHWARGASKQPVVHNTAPESPRGHGVLPVVALEGYPVGYAVTRSSPAPKVSSGALHDKSSLSWHSTVTSRHLRLTHRAQLAVAAQPLHNAVLMVHMAAGQRHLGVTRCVAALAHGADAGAKGTADKTNGWSVTWQVDSL
jgi:hypothetical protein